MNDAQSDCPILESVSCMVTEKECTKCHLTKPLSDYRKQSKAKFGVKPHCRECDDLIQNEYYTKNKKRVIKNVMKRRKILNKEEKLKNKLSKLEQNPPISDTQNLQIPQENTVIT